MKKVLKDKDRGPKPQSRKKKRGSAVSVDTLSETQAVSVDTLTEPVDTLIEPVDNNKAYITNRTGSVASAPSPSPSSLSPSGSAEASEAKLYLDDDLTELLRSIDVTSSEPSVDERWDALTKGL